MWLGLLLEPDVKIVFVKNITGPAKDAPVRYQVRLESVNVSFEIWEKIGKFFIRSDSRPPTLKHNSIRNMTRVRLMIMKLKKIIKEVGSKFFFKHLFSV